MKLAVGPIPLYHQLEQDLVARIAAEEFSDGVCLPTEEQIGQHYGVSRITVRKAMESLYRQGLIVRRRGVGSFVAPRRAGVHAIHLSGSLDEFLASAYDLAPKVVSLELVTAPEDIARAFELPKRSKVLRLELVSVVAEGPIAHSEFFFREELADLLRAEDIKGNEPIVRIVERKLGVLIARATQVISPDVAGVETAAFLGLAPDTPVLRTHRSYYTANGDLVEIARLRYHPERYRYEVDLRARPQAV